MTINQLNRERLEKIKSWRETYGAGSNVMLQAEEAEELACLALAAIDSKPFAYIIQDKYERERGVEGHLSRSHVSKYVSQDDIHEHEITCIPLYRHAQPAPEYPEVLPCPVLLEPGLRFGKGIKTSTMLAALARRAVYESDMSALSPEEIAEFQARIEDFKALIAQPVPVVSADLLHTAASAIEDLLTTKDRTGAGVWFDLPFRLRSAANAQPAPVVPDDVLKALQKVARIRLDMDGFDGDRRGIADCLCDAEEALIEVVNRRAAMLQAAPVCTCPSGDGSLRWPCPVHPGNSPVVPDGIERVASMAEYLGNFAAAAIIRQLAANQPQNAPQNIPEIIPDCWCRTCRPVVLNDMRFVVCPDCGNKRCPRANDHRNACTGSNEPGQEGGAYPDTPQEVKP
ncbi:hypothetical protein [Klebsiella quasipneumoniae]|uniref:hypothetical protein n=1 Tax=Klebsiella quasipneumoniae TaxID=1463165 RepID=UPI001F58CFFC|nr:hypothetical protein [Klebsiella quasipneumoniae]MCI2966722.1 hypothetical protein [Klebsiella quasipneumoniae]